MSGVTAQQVADAIGVSKRRVQQRAVEGCWVYSIEPVCGGQQKLYTILALPPDIRTPVLAHLATQESARAASLAAGKAASARVKLTAAFDSRAAEAARQAGLAKFSTLPPATKQRAEARAALVEMAGRYLKASGLAKRRGFELFSHQYSAGEIEVPAWIRTARPTVCANSLANWEAALAREGLARLGGKHGQHRKGTGIIDTNPALRDLVMGMLLDHPHCSAKLVMRAIRARFPAEEQPAYRTLQRWIGAWQADNKQLQAAVSNPDAWRSKFKAAGGSASQAIVRLNQRWEMDSTKGDLLLKDGSRHVIVGCIDVYTRRLKLHVSRSSSSAAVAATLRKALLAWGVPEQLGTDNGADYVSRHITRIVAGLGIEQELAPPFTPEHKPFIERAFGTFCRDLVELMAGYIGHSVEDRKAIEARRSFAQRLMGGGKDTGAAEIRMDAAELQAFCDRWTDEIYGVETHGGTGKTPFEMAVSWTEPVRRIADERALDVLLAPAPGGDGLRTITKKGIKLDRAWFEAPELGGREGEEVRLLLDDGDIGRVYVFSAATGEFLARAECPERTGISRAELAAERQAHQKRAIAEQKAALKAAAKRADTKNIVSEILAERAEAAGKLVAFPAQAVPHATEALGEAGRAAEWASQSAARLAGLPPPPAPLDAEEERKMAELAAEMAASAQIVNLPAQDSIASRYRRAVQIQRLIADKQPIRPNDLWWYQHYSLSPEYNSTYGMVQDFGMEAALASLE